MKKLSTITLLLACLASFTLGGVALAQEAGNAEQATARAELERIEEEQALAASEGRTLADWYGMGGFIMHGLLACSVLVLALVSGAAAFAAESQPVLTGVVNLNTASSAELQLLPGVGEVRAVAIVAMRKQRGGFKQIEDLLEVKGIGPAMLKRLRPYATVTGKTTAHEL